MGQFGAGFGGGASMSRGWGQGTPVPEDELLETIQQLIPPKNWGGNTQVFAKALPGRLVIRQTPQAHRQIESLLQKLDVEYYTSPMRASDVFGFGGGTF